MLRKSFACAGILALLGGGASAQVPPIGPGSGGQTTPTPQSPALVQTGTQWFEIWVSAQIGATTVAPTQNTARCAPFWASSAFHADMAAMQVSTLGTGPINFALYTDAIDATAHRHQPQTPITSPTTTFTVTGTGAVTAALGTAGVGVAIPYGLNWACINDTTAADAVRFIGLNAASTAVSSLIGSGSGTTAVNSAQLTSLTIAETAGTTTSNWPSLVGQTMTESNSTSIPNIALRIATVP